MVIFNVAIPLQIVNVTDIAYIFGWASCYLKHGWSLLAAFLEVARKHLFLYYCVTLNDLLAEQVLWQARVKGRGVGGSAPPRPRI